ncbi:MAG: V-type ATPase subunit [Planctomycetota bacterium]
MRPSGTDVRYAYATGRVRALESTFLTDAELSRMAEAADARAAAEFLREFPRYAEVPTSLASISALERALEAALNALRREVRSLSRDPDFTDVWLARFDLSAAKAALRSTALSPAREAEGPGAAEGALPASLSPVLRGLYAEAAQIARDTDDPFLVDCRLDAGYADLLCAAARRLASPLLAEFAVFSADLYNVRALLRARRIGLVVEKRGFLFARAGVLSVADLLQAFREETEIPPFLSRGRYAGLLGPHHDTAGDTFLEEVDLLVDNALTDFLRPAKLFSFGIEPLVGYAHALVLEVSNVRAVLAGKLLGMTPGDIRQRLRKSYV